MKPHGPLITVTEVAKALSGPVPPVVLDVRWNLGTDTGQAEYLAGHVPGAVWVDLDHDLASPPGDGGRHPLPDPDVFQAAMRRVGVTADRAVVAYDGANGMAAARLWWLLTDGGKTDVAVMTGGYAAWVAAGLPTETGSVVAKSGDITLAPGQRPVANAEDVARHVREGGALWDVRAPERYRGDSETVDPVAGHIPGARNLPVGMFTGPKGFHSHDALRQVFAEVEPGDVMSCGSGVTAAAGILAAEAAGIRGVALYPGSWSEWIRHPSRPVATGPEPAGS